MDHLIESMVQETFQNLKKESIIQNGFSYSITKNNSTLSLILYSNAQEGKFFFPLPYHGPFSIVFEQFNQKMFYFHEKQKNQLFNDSLDWWNLKKDSHHLIIENNPHGDFLIGPLGEFSLALHFFSKIPGISIHNKKILIPINHISYQEYYNLFTQGLMLKYQKNKSIELYLSERSIVRLFWLEVLQKISSFLQ